MIGLISFHTCSLLEKIVESEMTLSLTCHGFESAPDRPNKFQTEKLKTAFTMLRLVDVLTEFRRPKPEDKLVARGDRGMIMLRG